MICPCSSAQSAGRHFRTRSHHASIQAKPINRPDYIDYVCGIRAGQPITYFNWYFARNDGATNIRPGRCEDQPYRR